MQEYVFRDSRAILPPFDVDDQQFGGFLFGIENQDLRQRRVLPLIQVFEHNKSVMTKIIVEKYRVDTLDLK